MRQTAILALAGLILLFATAAYAAENKEKAKSLEGVQADTFPRVSLEGILNAVSKNSGKTFLVDAAVSSGVVVGQPRARNITFSKLLKVLRNNDLAAFSTGDTVSIVPVATIRQYPLPILVEDDKAVDDEEWVTRVIHLEKATARQLVPILRPLLPKQGHLVAHVGSNTLVIVDRYANTRRISKLVLTMDASGWDKNQ